MGNFADFVTSIVNLNEKIDYNVLLICLVLYIVLFWGAVSWWAYKDAKDRFDSFWTPIVVGILTYLLNLPFLFLYLLLRPIPLDEMEEWQSGGVNIPVVNFMGEEGVEMTFELRVHPKKLSNSNPSDMKIDVSFQSEDPLKKVVENTEVKELVTKQQTEGLKSRLQGIFSRNKNTNDKPDNNDEPANNAEPANATQSNDMNSNNNNQNSKKDKKNKHKKKKNR